MYFHDCPHSSCEQLKIDQTGQTLFLDSIASGDVDIACQFDVPAFPSFRPLALSDKAFLDGMLRLFPTELSEFTFTNLFAWRKSFGFSIAAFGEYVLIASLKENGVFLMEPIGPSSRKKSVIEQLFRAKPADMNIRFNRLSEPTALQFKDETGFFIEEDRDNFDYVYRTADLAELKGRKLDGKRNLVKHFRENTDFEYAPLTQSDVPESLRFEDEWCDVKGCANSPGLSREREAMEEMLRHFQALGLTGGVLRVSGKIAGVTLGERLNQTTGVVHIEKANSVFPGIYQALNMLFAQSQCQGLTFVNREQDLGIPGLRQAKESYHPHHMVKKYVLKKD